MTYKTLFFIHDLLVKERKALEEQVEKARDAFECHPCEDENYNRVKALYNSATESLYEAKRALDDFENENWNF